MTKTPEDIELKLSSDGMTPEREKEIRAECRLYCSESGHNWPKELLAEIDRLREDIQGLHAELLGQEHRLGTLYDIAMHERDQLSEKLQASELVRENTYKDLLELDRENGIALIALNGFEGLVDALEDSYDDSTIIRCEVTAWDIRRLKEALAKIRGDK